MMPNITDDGLSLIDDPRNIAETRQYLRDFNRLDHTTTTARELYDAMLGLYSSGPLARSQRGHEPRLRIADVRHISGVDLSRPKRV
jgi:hypothetical protein